MRNIFSVAVLLAAASVCAGPHFLDARFTQDPTSHHVTISYTLDEPAIISLDILTNGVSIGKAAVDALDDGTLHRRVSAGQHTFTWVPHKTWVQDVFTNNSVRVQVTAWPTNAPPDWMVLDLLHPGVVRWYASSAESPWGDFTNNVACKTDYLVLKRVPAGGRHFRMGNIAEASHYPTRNTPHIVHFSQDFYMAVFMMTKYQYDRLNEVEPDDTVTPTDALLCPTCGHTYDAVRGGNWPTSDAVWDNSFLKKLRDRYGIDFDLPTDAQWEYTCRAGTDTFYYNGSEKINLSVEARNALGWFYENSNYVTEKPVGLKQPNPWGFFDFYGNKFEWCRDWFTEDLGRAEVTDPRGPASTGQRLARGSSTQHAVTQAPDYRCNGGNGGVVGIRLWAPAGIR